MLVILRVSHFVFSCFFIIKIRLQSLILFQTTLPSETLLNAQNFYMSVLYKSKMFLLLTYRTYLFILNSLKSTNNFSNHSSLFITLGYPHSI